MKRIIRDLAFAPYSKTKQTLATEKSLFLPLSSPTRRIQTCAPTHSPLKEVSLSFPADGQAEGEGAYIRT
ncbi:MAG: hypothetical protein A2007_01195 [Verrucomicrobia bacterium GWC2_42_7]|nr:MAG: hypothetical protein A2007_01195 [Verrucomicrobia bacterium GWC2_42_7]